MDMWTYAQAERTEGIFPVQKGKIMQRLTRQAARESILQNSIQNLTLHARKEHLAMFWDREYYLDDDDFSDEEKEAIPVEIRKDMLSNSAPSNWFAQDCDYVLRFLFRFQCYGLTNSYLKLWLMELGIDCDEVTGEPEPMDACICCGYLVFRPGEGLFDICPVCFWHDAPGANQIGLDVAQRNFKIWGAMDEESLKIVNELNSDVKKMYQSGFSDELTTT